MADRYDYVVIGSGIAGLYAAILAREHGQCRALRGSLSSSATIGASLAPQIPLRLRSGQASRSYVSTALRRHLAQNDKPTTRAGG
ncbi:MAG: FAD-binding protein [Dehalococcoidia bacterium]|nr:FAD-binding protein [Dehalococcoidia bacterium]